HRDHVADDRRLQNVAVLESVFGAVLFGKVRELSQPTVPADDFQVRRPVINASGKTLVPGGFMRRTAESQENLQFLVATGVGLGDVGFSPCLLVGRKSRE